MSGVTPNRDFILAMNLPDNFTRVSTKIITLGALIDREFSFFLLVRSYPRLIRTRNWPRETKDDDDSYLTKGTSGRVYGLKVVFKSGPTMRDRLVKVKDKLSIDKQSSKIPT